MKISRGQTERLKKACAPKIAWNLSEAQGNRQRFSVWGNLLLCFCGSKMARLREVGWILILSSRERPFLGPWAEVGLPRSPWKLELVPPPPRPLCKGPPFCKDLDNMFISNKPLMTIYGRNLFICIFLKRFPRLSELQESHKTWVLPLPLGWHCWEAFGRFSKIVLFLPPSGSGPWLQGSGSFMDRKLAGQAR